MRTIPESSLPPDFGQRDIIKVKERNHYQRMTSSLERTLSRCNEMYAEYEQQTITLRENSKREGFAEGFNLCFSQLIQFIEEYEKKQTERLNTLQSTLLSSIKSSFNDSVIVERIIHHLQVQCGQQKPLRIIIPRSVNLPEGADDSLYTFTDDSHITIQNDMDSIRFPVDSVCQQWMSQADSAVTSVTQQINTLTPAVIQQLSDVSERFFDSKMAEHIQPEEENKDEYQ